MTLLSGIYSKTFLNTSDIPQAILNIEGKSRSNPLPWNGQFSPQLIQSLLEKYATSDTIVLDPFVGSGTVLLEAGRAGIRAFGAEINPAAVILARIYYFINVPRDLRRTYVERTDTVLHEAIPEYLPLFSGHEQGYDAQSIKTILPTIASSVQDPLQVYLLQALIVLLDFYRPELSTGKVFTVWHKLTKLVLSLPFSASQVEVFHTDARTIPLPESSVNLVITSPPYINVFNYHQKYRASAEALGWDLLAVAKSEIGSNRKHRGNRCLTVLQYCLDIAQTLRELARVCQPNGRLIFIVGRESLVRGTRFFNGEIVAEIAHRALGFKFALRQERVFLNKFGQNIFEDILHFELPQPHQLHDSFLEQTKEIGQELLTSAYQSAPDSSKDDIESALASLQKVLPSPIFRLNAVYQDSL